MSILIQTDYLVGDFGQVSNPPSSPEANQARRRKDRTGQSPPVWSAQGEPGHATAHRRGREMDSCKKSVALATLSCQKRLKFRFRPAPPTLPKIPSWSYHFGC